jgi:hypothetical protein
MRNEQHDCNRNLELEERRQETRTSMNNAQELNMSALHVPDYLGHRRENLQQEKAHYSLHARRLPSRLRQHVTTTSVL